MSKNCVIRRRVASLTAGIFSATTIVALCSYIFYAHPAMATSRIAGNVEAFCAPEPTVPSVSSCSTCHMTSNPGVTDLTQQGGWARSQATFGNFCPNRTTTPPPTAGGGIGGGTTTPPPGMSGGTGSGPGMSGMGGSLANMDDDDGGEEDDDDDNDNGSSGSSLRSLFDRIGL